MAIALVSNAAVSGTNGGTTGSIDTTGASLLVVLVAGFSASVTVTDSKSNTWTALTAQSASTPTGLLYYVANPTVGTGHTFTASGAGTYCTLAAAAFSGVATTSPFDLENGTSGAGWTNTTAKPGSITPSADNELIIAGFGVSTAVTLTIDSGMTITNQIAYSGGVNFGGGMAYKVQTTAAAINPLWGFAGSTDGPLLIASFKAAPPIPFVPRGIVIPRVAVQRSSRW